MAGSDWSDGPTAGAVGILETVPERKGGTVPGGSDTPPGTINHSKVRKSEVRKLPQFSLSVRDAEKQNRSHTS